MSLLAYSHGVARRLLALIPARPHDEKLPYALVFVALISAVLLFFALMPADLVSRILFALLAVHILLLTALVIQGMALSLAVHVGTAGGALVLMLLSLFDGGVYSSRMAWLLILPVTPMYVIGRRAGWIWFVLVLVLQVLIGLCTYLGWTVAPAPERSPVLALLSYSVLTTVLIVMPMIYHRMHTEALTRGRSDQLELETRRRELEQALQVREHFIATVSHELRTPMNAILGFNALLLSQVGDRPEARKVLMQTHQSADHLMTVINDILDYSQLRAGKLMVQPEVFALHEVVTHAHELFLPKVRSMAVAYRLELDPDLPRWVCSDRHRLTQVLVNLLANALKFTHRGSVVLRVQWLHSGVRFSVQDTGIGIPPERHDRIFQRFTQADAGIQARYGGNGLGLAISRQLVERLGGAMGFDSTPGQGSLFWFELPLQACEPPTRPASADLAARAMQTAQTPWRFLVVDDHPINRQLAKNILERAWPRAMVFEASHGQQALERLAQQDVDLVLMDMVMPVMDGVETTRHIRAQPAWQHLPVLGLTANVNPVDLEAFKVAGISELLLKPFEPGTLALKVERWLMQRV